jgi:hypothetical protein
VRLTELKMPPIEEYLEWYIKTIAEPGHVLIIIAPVIEIYDPFWKRLYKRLLGGRTREEWRVMVSKHNLQLTEVYKDWVLRCPISWR